MKNANDYFLAGVDGLDRAGKWIEPLGKALGNVFVWLLSYGCLVILTPFVFINWLCGENR